MNSNTQNLLIAGGLGVAVYLAWESNILGIRDIFEDTISGPIQDTFNLPSATNEVDFMKPYPWDYYTSKIGGEPQETHRYNEQFPYPYPPVGYPKTVAPTTLPAAHYRIAGTPNIMQIPGTTTIMSPPNAYMPNPNLWIDKGGIVTPGTRIAMPSEINFGPYHFESPIFSRSRYPVYGTNIDYPFLVGPVGPSPCPLGQYRASDGRCYAFSSPPPEPCSNPNYYRAADGRCYPFR